ncbi:MAG: cytochrome c-type biogenesis protein CcmH [Hyphomonadaceae bacterium]
MSAGFLIALLLQAGAAAAEAPLADPAEEARAQALMREIRCVVCENEPVSQSTADIAVDMRRTIRVHVEKGESDADVRKFFKDRYGQFVLFRPPTDGLGTLLWAFPFTLLLVVGGVMGLRMFSARHRDLTPVPDDRGGGLDPSDQP